jgi:uncharacterized protein YkwD
MLSLRRTARAGVAALVGSTLLVTAASASASSCPGSDAAPDAADLRIARGAVLCLVNEQRAAAGLAPVNGNLRLAAAASAHAADMVGQRYFAHDSLDGSDFALRIERSGYLGHRKSWMLGENLAWGTSSLATPEQIVAGWMGSAGHRANILAGGFRDIGIAVVPGVPVDGNGDQPGATYATEFGQRSAAVTAERASTGLVIDARARGARR